MQEKEIWKDVVDYEGVYQVSSLGVIRSVDRIYSAACGKVVNKKGRTIKSHPEHRGYMQITLCLNGTRKTMKVHRIVLEAFTDVSSRKETVNHKNGIKSDNRLVNLEWNTLSENVRHAFNTGLNIAARGENNSRAKLKESDVIDIKRNCTLTPFDLNKFATKYSITKQAIRLIVQDKNWKHIKA